MTVPTQSIQQTVFGDGNIVVGSGSVHIYRPAPLPERERETRIGLATLLQRVRAGWIEGVLKQALHETALLDLGMEARIQLVDEKHLLPQENPRQQNMAIPAGKSLPELFDESGRLLLILGEPGSGKTITLLRLAQELLERAGADRNFSSPVPVVFNLSSWTESRPILEWMALEMAAKYKVPVHIGREWLARYRLLPLLDGLDEVQSVRREACVQALNTFVTSTGLSGLVVCSRTDEYTRLGVKLALNNAICLQALAPDQILTHLASQGERLAGLHSALQNYPTLLEMARSPLMLSVMSMAYAGAPPAAFAQSGRLTEEEWRPRLFDAYIQRMLNRKVQGGLPYAPQQITGWLAWLAKKMVQHGQTIFLIEGLQPSWLETRAQRWKYTLAARIIAQTGMFGLMFLSGLFSGVITGVIDGLYFDRQAQRTTIPLPNRRQRVLYILLICFIYISFYSGTYVAFISLEYLLLAQLGAPAADLQELVNQGLLGFTTATVVSLFPALLIGLRGSGQTLQNDIRTIETLKWSWTRALKGSALLGMGIGLAATLLTILVATLAGIRDALSLGLLAAIGFPAWAVYVSLYAFPISGLTSKVAEGKMLPNQGIRMSIRNAVKAGVFISAGIGAAFAATTSAISVILVVLSVFTGELPASMNTLLMTFVVVVFMFFLFIFLFVLFTGPMIASWYGGFDAVYHYVLRHRLEREGFIPRGYERFLDFAVERIFLRKVGGGYIFVHRLLMEHFAALEPRNTATGN